MTAVGWCAGVTIVISMSSTECANAATSPGSPTRLAVEAYLKKEYRFDREVDRKYATHGRIADVTRDLGVDRVSYQSVMSFPIRAGAPISHALVAIDSERTVRLLDDMPSINQLFDKPVADLNAADIARLRAEIILRVRHYDGYLNHGYPLGINVIDTTSDIPEYEQRPRRDSAAQDYTIEPPQIEMLATGFRFTLYSWTPAGGAVLRHELWIEGDGVSNYRIETLEEGVGAHGPAH